MTDAAKAVEVAKAKQEVRMVYPQATFYRGVGGHDSVLLNTNKRPWFPISEPNCGDANAALLNAASRLTAVEESARNIAQDIPKGSGMSAFVGGPLLQPALEVEEPAKPTHHPDCCCVQCEHWHIRATPIAAPGDVREGAPDATVQGQGEVKLDRFSAITVTRCIGKEEKVYLASDVDPLLRKLDEATKENERLKAAKYAYQDAVDEHTIRCQKERDAALERLEAAESKLDEAGREIERLTVNRDQWERNSAAENKRAGGLEVKCQRLQAELANARTKVLREAADACKLNYVPDDVVDHVAAATLELAAKAILTLETSGKKGGE